MSTVMAIWPRQRRSSSLTKIFSEGWWVGATSACFVPLAPERNTAPFSRRFERAMAPVRTTCFHVPLASVPLNGAFSAAIGEYEDTYPYENKHPAQGGVKFRLQRGRVDASQRRMGGSQPVPARRSSACAASASFLRLAKLSAASGDTPSLTASRIRAF